MLKNYITVMPIIIFIATTTTAVSLLPQLLKIIRTKSAKDISLLSIFYMSICAISWILYGLMMSDFVVWSPNVVLLGSCVGIAFLKIRYNE